MIKIGLIPLDSRPCNTLWVEQFCEISQFDLKMFPREKCGNLENGTDINEIIAWLRSNALDLDYLIVSADGFCSGGLVQARLGNINLTKTIENIKIFAELKKQNPKLKIFIFDTIMRTSISSLDNETAKYWAKVNQYSRALGRYHFLKLEEDRLEIEKLKEEIPSQILTTYHHARFINHSLNKEFIKLVNEGVCDYLLLLQEDSMPFGLQKIEQEVLTTMINEFQISNKIKFYNGTDEGATVLLGKIILANSQLEPKIYLHTPGEDILNKTMLFEDRPFIDNVNLMLESMNMFYVNNPEEADFILSIYAEKDNVDLDLNTFSVIRPNKDDRYYQYFKELNQFIDLNYKVCFVDLLFPNGGSDELLCELNSIPTIYSAWNTASNSLGSALCHLAVFLAAERKKLPTKSLSDAFTYERILDDCFFQTIVRRKVNQKALAKNINVYNLKEDYELVLEWINMMMIEVVKEYPFLDGLNYKISLPWKRTFEAEIRLVKEET